MAIFWIKAGQFWCLTLDSHYIFIMAVAIPSLHSCHGLVMMKHRRYDSTQRAWLPNRKHQSRGRSKGEPHRASRCLLFLCVAEFFHIPKGHLYEASALNWPFSPYPSCDGSQGTPVGWTTRESFGRQLLQTRWLLRPWRVGGNTQSRQMGHSERLAKSLLDAVVPVRVDTLWEGQWGTWMSQ